MSYNYKKFLLIFLKKKLIHQSPLFGPGPAMDPPPPLCGPTPPNRFAL